MITQVSSFSNSQTAKDPRRTAKRTQFKHAYNVPYKSSYVTEDYGHQKRRALNTSVAIVLGAMGFMALYFMLSGLRSVKR